ncbi:MAG: phage holin family protein [Sphingomonadales bacterium]|jgi:uncharacterized membrane protein YqjE
MADITALLRQLLASALAVLAAEAKLASAEVAAGSRVLLRVVLLVLLALLLAGLAVAVAVAAAVLALAPTVGVVQACLIITLLLAVSVVGLALAARRALRAEPLLPRRSAARLKALLGNEDQG